MKKERSVNRDLLNKVKLLGKIKKSWKYITSLKFIETVQLLFNFEISLKISFTIWGNFEVQFDCSSTSWNSWYFNEAIIRFYIIECCCFVNFYNLSFFLFVACVYKLFLAIRAPANQMVLFIYKKPTDRWN